MKQEILIKAIGFDVNIMNGKLSIGKAKPLVKEMDGEVACGDFSYSSDMELYLSEHLQPDVAYALNCANCYLFHQRHYHEQAYKMIRRYLEAMCSKGISLKPSSNWKIVCHPVANLSGMHGQEKITDPAHVKSRQFTWSL